MINNLSIVTIKIVVPKINLDDFSNLDLNQNSKEQLKLTTV